MKKIVVLLLFAVAMLVALSGCNDSSDYPDKEANPASDFEYEKNDDGGITIMKYVGTDETVVIPQTIDDISVTELGRSAFVGLEHVKTLMMPDSVRFIGSAACGDMAQLTNVRLSKNVEIIGTSAFAGCHVLTEINLSMKTLTHIGDYAFNGCINLKKVTFGDNIEYIDDKAFIYCESLEEAILPKNLKSLGEYAFGECYSIKKIFIPKTLEEWGMSPFIGNISVTEIVLEDGLKKIGSYGCFAGCLVESVTIPDSVEKIADIAFTAFPNLKSVYFEGDAPKEMGGLSLGRPEEVTVYYDPSKDGWDTTSIKDEYTLKALK